MGDFAARLLDESFSSIWQHFCNLMYSNRMKNLFPLFQRHNLKSFICRDAIESFRVENHLLQSPSVVSERKQLIRASMCQSKAGISNLDFLCSKIKLLALLSAWRCTFFHQIRLSCDSVVIEACKDYYACRFHFLINIWLEVQSIASFLANYTFNMFPR